MDWQEFFRSFPYPHGVICHGCHDSPTNPDACHTFGLWTLDCTEDTRLRPDPWSTKPNCLTALLTMQQLTPPHLRFLGLMWHDLSTPLASTSSARIYEKMTFIMRILLSHLTRTSFVLGLTLKLAVNPMALSTFERPFKILSVRTRWSVMDRFDAWSFSQFNPLVGHR
jgi:hypothetical protein